MPRIHSRDKFGFTVMELMVGVLVGGILLLLAGGVYVGVSKSYSTGAKKLLAQREATLLSSNISRRLRVGSSFGIYVLPNRSVPADSGNGVAIYDHDGHPMGRLEWSSSLRTLVDSTGARVTSMALQNVLFKKDPGSTHVLRYRYQTDDGAGDLVDIQSGAAVRN
jgi:Tfp pilus assembly protein PilW